MATIPQGYNSAVGIGVESTPQTAEDPTLFFGVKSITDDESRTMIERVAVRKRRSTDPGIPGPYSVGGNWSMEVDAGNIGQILKLALGKSTPTQQGSYDVYSHEFILEKTLSTFTLEKDEGGVACRQIAGCMIDTLGFSIGCEGDQILTANVGFKGYKPTEHAATSPTFGTITPFTFLDMGASGVYIAGAGNAYAQSATVNLANNIEEVRTLPNGAFLYGLSPGRAKVTGSLNLVFGTDAERHRFWGGAAETTPLPNPGGFGLILKFTSGTEIGSSTGYYYDLEIKCNNVFWTRHGAPINGPGVITQSVDFAAYESADAAYDDISAILVNNIASYT